MSYPLVNTKPNAYDIDEALNKLSHALNKDEKLRSLLKLTDDEKKLFANPENAKVIRWNIASPKEEYGGDALIEAWLHQVLLLKIANKLGADGESSLPHVYHNMGGHMDQNLLALMIEPVSSKSKKIDPYRECTPERRQFADKRTSAIIHRLDEITTDVAKEFKLPSEAQPEPSGAEKSITALITKKRERDSATIVTEGPRDLGDTRSKFGSAEKQ